VGRAVNGVCAYHVVKIINSKSVLTHKVWISHECSCSPYHSYIAAAAVAAVGAAAIDSVILMTKSHY